MSFGDKVDAVVKSLDGFGRVEVSMRGEDNCLELEHLKGVRKTLKFNHGNESKLVFDIVTVSIGQVTFVSYGDIRDADEEDERWMAADAVDEAAQ